MTVEALEALEALETKRRPRYLLKVLAVALPALASAFGSYMKAKSESANAYKVLADQVTALQEAVKLYHEDELEWRKLMIKSLSDFLQVESVGPVTAAMRRYGYLALKGKGDVPVNILHTMQKTYDSEIVERFAEGKRESRVPIVAAVEGVLWLENGHHRAVLAAKNDGLLHAARLYSDGTEESSIVIDQILDKKRRRRGVILDKKRRKRGV
jgi:hypothetical protein